MIQGVLYLEGCRFFGSRFEILNCFDYLRFFKMKKSQNP